jgi:hypothetical protein
MQVLCIVLSVIITCPAALLTGPHGHCLRHPRWNVEDRSSSRHLHRCLDRAHNRERDHAANQLAKLLLLDCKVHERSIAITSPICTLEQLYTPSYTEPTQPIISSSHSPGRNPHAAVASIASSSEIRVEKFSRRSLSSFACPEAAPDPRRWKDVSKTISTLTRAKQAKRTAAELLFGPKDTPGAIVPLFLIRSAFQPVFPVSRLQRLPLLEQCLEREEESVDVSEQLSEQASGKSARWREAKFNMSTSSSLTVVLVPRSLVIGMYGIRLDNFRPVR